MDYQHFAALKVNDALRDAEIARLAIYGNRPQKNQIRQYLAKAACRIGMVKSC